MVCAVLIDSYVRTLSFLWARCVRDETTKDVTMSPNRRSFCPKSQKRPWPLRATDALIPSSSAEETTLSRNRRNDMDVRPPHIPAVRRVDGDRITEMIPAREWLSRKDKNQLRINPRGVMPPSLPRYMSRDHLHDRNRELCVFDPANPGLQTYVHVTRRRQPDPYLEQKIHDDRMERFKIQHELEKAESVAANELMELRSQNIRALLAHRSRGWSGPGIPKDDRPATVPGSQAYKQQRAERLEQQLKDFRSTYRYTGYSNPVLAPAAASAPARKTPLRGGWPVQETGMRGLEAYSLEA